MSDDDLKPVVESVGKDEAELFRQWHSAAIDTLKANEAKTKQERAEQALREQYATRECLYVMVERMPSREGAPDRWRARCVAGLPAEIPELSVLVDGTAEDALHESRFAFAELLCKARVCKSMDDARSRAAKADLVLAEVVR